MQGAPEHTVFVLGAGASLAEAQARRRKQQNEHPPLDANFFRRVRRYRSGALYDRVQRQAQSLGESDLARENPPVGLEEYLGRLYFNVQHNPRKASVQAYFDLIDLYAREVLTTTQWMVDKGGKIKEVLQREVRAGNTASVITFNIDLLIENALQQLARSRPRADWDLSTAYGFRDPMRTLHGIQESFDNAGSRTEVPLYKLHGSVNWVFRTRDYYPPADLVGKRRQVWQVQDKRLPAIERMRYDAGGKGRRWYLFPLIVPPVYEKHGFIKMHLQEVWENAETALLSATKVVFWGYSFPAADLHARHFFQGMADQNPVLRTPTIINPDPQAGAALWPLLRADHLAHYRDVDSYLAA